MEPHGASRWDQQGTGSQRALFWSMLEVRSELNRIADERKRQEKALNEKEKELKKFTDKLPTLKKDDAKKKCEEDIQKLQDELQTLRVGAAVTGVPVDTFLPGYMLLIEEPETALHPSTIRAAKEHLYALAAESGWQGMLSTHHPVFVDPLKDHTTIVRLHRPDVNEPPNVYRADEMAFTPVERENLKSLLAFDTTVAEMFFGPRVIIVEGDTEFAAFEGLMDQDGEEFPVASRPLILRARGKATIPTLIRMLTHYKVDFTVLHDIDAPRTAKGDRVNPAYTINESICRSVAEAQKCGRQVIHRCSCPFFEQHHGMAVPAKDKPFEAWRTVRANQSVRTSVDKVLKELVATPGDETITGCFREKIKKWAAENADSDPAYVFAD
jgi:putative ATP-dependent endonuclease of the OLD family